MGWGDSRSHLGWPNPGFTTANEVDRSSGFKSRWPPKEGDRPEPISRTQDSAFFVHPTPACGGGGGGAARRDERKLATGLAWDCGLGKDWSRGRHGLAQWSSLGSDERLLGTRTSARGR